MAADVNAPYYALLRRFSTTEALVRGTALVSYVVFSSAMALLPGFGPQGILISNAIQMSVEGVLEFPFGWFADRIGCARATIVSYLLNILITLALGIAVFWARMGETQWAWGFICIEAILSALAISLREGAFQAGYSRWYADAIKQKGLELDQAPPLFIKSARFSTFFRFVIPLLVISVVLILKLLPNPFFQFDSYTSTFIALGFVIFFQCLTLFRVASDLSGQVKTEGGLKRREETQSLFKASRLVFRAMQMNPAAFILYATGRFQYSISCFCIAGLAIQKIGTLGFPEPYGWLTGISILLGTFLLDTLFWNRLGHRMDRRNAMQTIRFLSIFLIFSSFGCWVLYVVEANPWLQAFAFAGCALSGVTCTSAIQRYLTSHLNEWVEKGLEASCLSFAETLGMLAGGIVLMAILGVDGFLPSTTLLLALGILVAGAILFYASAGPQLFGRRSIPLKTFLSESFLTIAILGGTIIGVLNLHTFVSTLAEQQGKIENQKADQLTQVAIESDPKLAQPDWGMVGKKDGEVPIQCLTINGLMSYGDCYSKNCWFLSPKYSRSWVSSNEKFRQLLTVRFDRSPFIEAVLRRIGFTVALILVVVGLIFILLRAITERIDRELKGVLNQREGESDLTIQEIRDLSERITAYAAMTNDIASHRAIAEHSARVAHDMRSPLTVLNLIRESPEFPPEIKEILKGTIQRLNEITKDLLSQEKKLRTNHPMSELVEQIVQEKKVQYQPRPELAIKVETSLNPKGPHCSVDPVLFKSILSNIIDNSAEAIEGAGMIHVNVESREKQVSVSVKDTGKGIPAELIPKLGDSKISFGKDNGNGIGLFHAQEEITRWGGKMQIESQLGNGTRVTLYFPRNDTDVSLRGGL